MPDPLTAATDLERQLLADALEFEEKAAEAPERLAEMATVDVGTTPHEVVYEENKLRLLRYDPLADERERQAVPLVLVYALINRPYILDLQPDRSVIRRMLEAGFDVYMIDWGEPSELDTTLSLHDYVNRYIDNCVDVVRDRSGQESINILGYCMGGTMSVMYAALHPEKVRNLGLMAAGLCFDGTGGILEMWGNEEFFSPGAITETFGNVPAEFLDVGFALMDPVHNYVTKYGNLYDNIDDDDFVENFARMERWLNDPIDVAGTAYREFLEEIYQENKLYRNELELNGERVDLGNITMPVVQVIGEYDHLIPPEASKPFNDVVGSDDTEIMEYSTGHIGLSVSRSTHENLWPAVAEWFAERSTVPIVGFSDLTPALRDRLPADYQQCSHFVTEERVFSCGASIEEAVVHADVAEPIGPVVDLLREVGAYNRARERGYRWVANHRSDLSALLSLVADDR